MKQFLQACRYYFGYAFVFSFFVNILQLTFSIYMLQVYDKVLTSYNLSTLTVITVGAIICLVVMALLEWIRSRLLVRAGIEFDNMLGETVLHHNLSSATQPVGQLQEAYGTLKDVQMLRNFLGGNAVFAFFDLPWMPIYLIFIFILHPSLGLVAVIVVFSYLFWDSLQNASPVSALMLQHNLIFMQVTLPGRPCEMPALSGPWVW